MFKQRCCALLLAGALAVAFATGPSAPANANVLYNLTFENSGGTVNEGTGVLTLNYATLAAVDSISANLSATNFVSVVTTTIDSQGAFSITPLNLSYGSFSTSPTGTFYSLTVAETVPSCDYSGSCDILVLDLYTSTWQIHDKYNSTLDSGALAVAGPFLPSTSLDSTPTPAALPLFATGIGILGMFVWIRKRKAAVTA
jgi:hypothetical protein